MAITIPDWILQSNKNALFSSRDLYQLFGYKSAASFGTAHYKGAFPKPDVSSEKIEVKTKILYWKKQTVIDEINRRNNGEKLNLIKKDVRKIESNINIVDSNKILNTNYLPHG